MKKLSEELSELMAMKNWVCHLDKVPKNPVTGGNARADVPETWGTYDEAVRAVAERGFSGIGFQFGLAFDDAEAFELERITGIDLDHVVREDGTLEEFASEIVEQMDSYTELSPSGTGLHILCKGKLPNVGRKKKLSNGCIIEMYNNRHYFTVTGNIYGIERGVEVRTSELQELYERYFSDVKDVKSEVSGVPDKPVEAQKITEYLSEVKPSSSKGEYFSAEDLSDSELLDRIFYSSRGYGIETLFRGNISSYSSHSEADLALMSHLAYWTNGDANRMDRLFRQSGLMREKWDERHGDQTYGEKTISRVLSDFQPYVRKQRTSSVDISSLVASMAEMDVIEDTHVADDEIIENVSEVIVSSQEDILVAQQDKSVVKKPLISSRSVKKYIHGEIEGWGVRRDLERFRSFANRKTGFSNIDTKVSFYPGLYVLGAISSLGKTTFIHQVADQLARAGEHVLFFSLEQTCLEMVTKGVSRLMAQKNLGTAVSAIDIRRGVENDLVLEAMEEYASFTEHEIILECNFETQMDDIVRIVKEYISETGVSPVVIVDYLQVIHPSDAKQSAKDAVDSHVRALKNLQKENDLIVVLVSSLNRQNYLTPIDYESFKESGGIEYTADVIWGLQLQVVNDEIFDQEKKLKAKREKIRMAKRAKPREIEFVCLKNRYGESNYTCKFKYYPQYDYFIPVEDSSSSGNHFASSVRL